jgi:hypothetical protein
VLVTPPVCVDRGSGSWCTEPRSATFGSAGLPAVEDAAGRHYPRHFRTLRRVRAFGARRELIDPKGDDEVGVVDSLQRR